MTRLLAIAFFLATSTPAVASALRIDIDKGSHASSPIQFELVPTNIDDVVAFAFSMPEEQAPLEHLWRTDIWLLSDEGGAALMVPIALERNDEGVLEGQFMVNIATLDEVVLVIRCGEHAPLAETLYQIDVGSFATSSP